MNRFAVIPTRGDRFDVLYRCAEAIRPQVDRIIVVDNSDRGVIFNDGYHPHVTVVHCEEQPPNISRLWNLGLARAAELANAGNTAIWEVAVLNDDAIVPAYWMAELGAAMRSAGAVAAGYRQDGPTLHKQLGPTSLAPDQRLPGHAFLLAGEWGLRADENLQWWCGDNDLDLQARQKGGTLILPGDQVQHLYPDQSTVGELRARTALDMQYFVDKWGFRPW